MERKQLQVDEPGGYAEPAWAAQSAQMQRGDATDVFRTVIDALPVLAWSANADGCVDYFNKQLMTYIGVTAGEALDLVWLAALHPDDQQRMRESWRSTVQSGRPSEFEARMRRSDGMYRWFLIRSNAQHDENGRVLRWYGTNIDIEDRRHAELAARETETNLRAIVDSIPGLVFTTSSGGETDFINQRLLDYFGRSLEALKGWVAKDTIHPDDLARVNDHWTRALRKGEPSEIDMRLRGADGSYRWFHYRATPMREPQGEIVRWCVLATDTDDLRRAQETLRATQDRLSRAMHLASLSELSASIAHEINQPLAAVVANGHANRRWLSSDPPNVERALLSAERIVRDGVAAADIVTRMRSLFARTPPAMEPLQMDTLIDGVCELLSGELQCKSIVLARQLPQYLPSVSADRVQMQQVLANLIRNAIESMENVCDRVRALAIRSTVVSTELVVEIADSGPGIESVPSIFESLYTTKSNGMGMGLAICRSIIDAHGGRIWVAENTSQGATFVFALPLQKD